MPVVSHVRTATSIKIIDTEPLRFYEKPIKSRVEWLVSSLREMGIQRDPIIVDQGSMVVIDGLHRVLALNSLGIYRVVGYLVDYRDPQITVKSWYRIVKGVHLKSRLLQLANDSGLPRKVEERHFDPVTFELEEVETPTVIWDSHDLNVKISGLGDILVCFALLRAMVRSLEMLGCTWDYATESDAQQKMLGRNINGVGRAMPPASKHLVMDSAISGSRLPDKVNRHLVPGRPLHVDIPLDWLKGQVDAQLLSRHLAEHLSQLSFHSLPSGCVIDGRRYEEPVVLYGSMGEIVTCVNTCCNMTDQLADQ